MTNICVCWYCRADLFNDEQIQGVIQYEPPWDAEYKEWTERNKVNLGDTKCLVYKYM